MLNFIYYPVSWILWFWHKVFGAIPFLGPDSGVAWALAVMFLVFTLRAILFKPFVSQVRSMRKMQEFAPEIQKLKKKYGNDKQRLTQEMQKLQSQHGVNPLGGCLPILIQIPVFIGLFQVLKEFKPGKTENYVFNAAEVQSFVDADLFGAKLGASVFPHFTGGLPLEAYGTTVGQMLIVMIPLMITAGVLTHITARHSVARQTEAQAATQQTAIMNKLMLYLFPIGVVVGAPFLPLAILLYWVANNLWTLLQQRVVYRRIDREEADKKEQEQAQRQARAPRPGQKPSRARPDAKATNPSGAGDDVVEEAVDAEAGAEAAGANGAATATSDGQAANPATQRTRGPAAKATGSGGTGSKAAASKPAGSKPAGSNRARRNGASNAAPTSTGAGAPNSAKPAAAATGTAKSAASPAGEAKSGKQPTLRPTAVKKGRKRR